MQICGPADLRIERVKCGQSLRILSADLMGKMRMQMRIFSRPLQTNELFVCPLAALTFVVR